MKAYSSTGVSFFTARDRIITEEHTHGVCFESNTRTVREIGQVSLLFVKFHAASMSKAYGTHEKIFAIGRGGRPSLLEVGDLGRQDFYEVMIILKGMTRDLEDPLLCTLWIRNKHILFSTYLVPKLKQNLQSTLFFGGLKWFTPELPNKALGRLQISKNLRLLSNIYLSFDRLPMQFKDQDQPEDIFLEESW